MKNSLLPFTVFTLLFLSFGCQKDTPNDPLPAEESTVLDCGLNTPTFSIDLQGTDSFFDLTEDLARNIVLLGKTSVIKYNYKGTLVWSKPFSFPGTPQNIIQADGDNYFMTTATMNVGHHEA